MKYMEHQDKLFFSTLFSSREFIFSYKKANVRYVINIAMSQCVSHMVLYYGNINIR